MLFDIGLSNIFWICLLKERKEKQKTKTKTPNNKWDLIKLKSFAR